MTELLELLSKNEGLEITVRAKRPRGFVVAVKMEGSDQRAGVTTSTPIEHMSDARTRQLLIRQVKRAVSMVGGEV